MPPEDKKPEEKTESDSSCEAPKEIGGRGGPDPSRYGDWEIGGRCVDF